MVKNYSKDEKNIYFYGYDEKRYYFCNYTYLYKGTSHHRLLAGDY